MSLLEEHASDLGARYEGFKFALSLLEDVENPRIVETGTLRIAGNWGDGQSTRVFADWLAPRGGSLKTIDLSSENMAVCRAATSRHAGIIEYVVEDSLLALRGEQCDLLYLDSYDYLRDMQRDAQLHCVAEFVAAYPSLVYGTILMVDDADLPGGGKPGLLNEILHRLGWALLFSDKQVVWANVSSV